MSQPQSVYPEGKANISDPAVKNRVEFGHQGVFYANPNNDFSKSPIAQQQISSGGISYNAVNNRTFVSLVGSPSAPFWDLVPTGGKCNASFVAGDRKNLPIFDVTGNILTFEGNYVDDFESALVSGNPTINFYYANSGAAIQFLSDSVVETATEKGVVGNLNLDGIGFLAGSVIYGEFESLSLTSGFAKVYLY